MEFVLINKDEPADVQCYYTDNVIKTESAANLATAGKTYMLRLGNILSDKSFNNSYIYTENGWRVIDVSSGGGGGGGTTYTAGDGIEISGDVISALLAENSGLEFVDGKLSVAKAPTTKPFNEDTYNDFVFDESHNIQESHHELRFTTFDDNDNVTDFDTYLESGNFKIMVDCEEHSYNESFVMIPFRDADGNQSEIMFSESSCTIKSVTVEFTNDEKHIYIEKDTGETEDYSDMIEDATGIYKIYIQLYNEYSLPEVTYSHEIIEDGTIKLSGAPAKQLEAGMGIEIVNGKIQSIPHYRSDEYLNAPYPYIASSYGELTSLGNDFVFKGDSISFNYGTLINPIRLSSGDLFYIWNINEGIFASNYNIDIEVGFLDNGGLNTFTRLNLNCTDEVVNIGIVYDDEENQLFAFASDSEFNYIDDDHYNFDTPIVGSPYFVVLLDITTAGGFNEEMFDMDVLNDGRTYYVPINYENTFFQLQNSEGVTYDYQSGTFSFEGGGGSSDTSQSIEDYGYTMDDLKDIGIDQVKMELYNKEIYGLDNTIDEIVTEWAYKFNFLAAVPCDVEFRREQGVFCKEENVELYGDTTFFMKRDGKGLIQYGFTTGDENSNHKKHTYSYNMLDEGYTNVPCDLYLNYKGDMDYGLLYITELSGGTVYINPENAPT